MNTNSKNILLVEDDQQNAFALQLILEDMGHQVTLAQNGLHALRQLMENNSFQIIFMDIKMPELNGYETIKHIRKNPKLCHLPIIALTAQVLEEEKESCLSAGANAFASKPIKAEKLKEIISEFAL